MSLRQPASNQDGPLNENHRGLEGTVGDSNGKNRQKKTSTFRKALKNVFKIPRGESSVGAADQALSDPPERPSTMSTPDGGGQGPSTVCPAAAPPIQTFNQVERIGNAVFANSGTVTMNYYAPPSNETKEVSTAELLTWIGGPSFAEIYKTALEQQMPGTGTWFLEREEFKRLVSGTASIVWGTGLPGSGKTILSAISTRDLTSKFEDQTDVVVVKAFLRYSERHTPRDVFASLLSQLARAHTGVSNYIKTVYSSQKTTAEATPPTSSELVTMLAGSAGLLKRVYVVIDGLDEATDEVKEKLLQSLPRISGVRMLIMSRPLDSYAEQFTPSALKVSIQALTDDIDLYVRDRANNCPRLVNILQRDTASIDDLSSRIQQKSQGMFLLARLQVEMIERNSTTRKQMYRMIETLPSGINAMYDLAIQRIEEAPENDAKLARRVLTWLLHAQSPLTVDDIRLAMGISYENKIYDSEDIPSQSLILHVCVGLVQVVEVRKRGSVWYTPDYELRFVHYTVKEYLAKNLSSLGVSDPHGVLAVSCLIYLENFMTLPTENNSFELHPLLLDSSPLADYALSQWGRRARLSYNEQGKTHPYILSFISSRTGWPLTLADRGMIGGASTGICNGLHIATYYRLIEVITLKKLDCRGDLDYGYTPFHIAALHDEIPILRCLVESYGAQGITERTKDGSTILHLAARNRATRVLEDLLYATEGPLAGYGESLINSVTRSGDTPLLQVSDFYQETNADKRVLSLLLSHPAVDVNLQNDFGATPLMGAARGSRPERVAQLLSHPSTNGNLVEKAGRTALIYAAEISIGDEAQAAAHLRCLTLLLGSPKVDIHIRDNRGRSALDWGCIQYQLPQHDTIPVYPILCKMIQHDGWNAEELFKAAVGMMMHHIDRKFDTDNKYLRTRVFAAYAIRLLLACAKRRAATTGEQSVGDAIGEILICASDMPCLSCIPIVLEALGGPKCSVNGVCRCKYCSKAR